MSQPGQIGPLLRRIPPTELAQAVLSPLQHSIAIGWQDPSLDWRRETAERVGSNIHDLLEHKALLATGKLVVDMKRLRKRRKPGEPPRKLGRPYKSDLRDLSAAGWDKRDLCQVGYWLMYQARTMPYFTGRLNSRVRLACVVFGGASCQRPTCRSLTGLCAPAGRECCCRRVRQSHGANRGMSPASRWRCCVEAVTRLLAQVRRAEFAAAWGKVARRFPQNLRQVGRQRLCEHSEFDFPGRRAAAMFSSAFAR
jgi:hypothetical protein